MLPSRRGCSMPPLPPIGSPQAGLGPWHEHGGQACIPAAPSPRASRAGGGQGRPGHQRLPGSLRLPLSPPSQPKRPASPSSEPSGVEERAWGGRAGGGAGGKPGHGALSRPHPVTLRWAPARRVWGGQARSRGSHPSRRVLSWEQGSIAGPETPDPQPGQPARQSRLSPPVPAGRATAQTLCPSKAVLLGPLPPTVAGTPGWPCHIAPCHGNTHFAQSGGGPWLG